MCSNNLCVRVSPYLAPLYRSVRYSDVAGHSALREYPNVQRQAGNRPWIRSREMTIRPQMTSLSAIFSDGHAKAVRKRPRTWEEGGGDGSGTRVIGSANAGDHAIW